MKRALVAPDRLAEVAYAQSDPGLIDLAQIYDEFQQRLLNLGWTDLEGLSAYALEALGSGKNVLTDVALLVVDGFDNFNPAQMQILQIAAVRVAETWITLPGTPEMNRPAQRRFAPVASSLAESQPLEIQTLPTAPRLPPTLLQVEQSLFETPGQPFRSGSDLQRIEARSPVEEAREGLRWLKAHILRDGLALSACRGRRTRSGNLPPRRSRMPQMNLACPFNSARGYWCPPLPWALLCKIC